MVVGVDVKAALAEEIGEAGIARGVLGQPMVDLDDGARMATSVLHIKVELRAGRRFDLALLAEWHCLLVSPALSRSQEFCLRRRRFCVNPT